MNHIITKFFLLFSLIMLNINGQTVSDFTYYPEDKSLQLDFTEPFSLDSENYHSSYYFSNTNSDILTDPRSGMRIYPYIKVNILNNNLVYRSHY